MLTKYIQAALHHAKYEILDDDGSYYGEIPVCNGVNANTSNLEECREQLEEVLEEWILLSIYKHLPLPVFDGIELTINEVA
jgi:predicted RNase H-like HicB family nuclease